MIIYRITNIVNGKFYIGSSSYKTMKTRKAIHLYNLRRGSHHSPYLQNVYNKYGEKNLRFEILRDGIEDKHELLVWEQRYINDLNPNYNMRRDVTRPMQSTTSREHLEKMWKSRRGVPPTNKGIPMSNKQRYQTSKKLICINTGVIYSSAWDAAIEYRTSGGNIRKSCRTGSLAKGLNFKFI